MLVIRKTDREIIETHREREERQVWFVRCSLQSLLQLSVSLFARNAHRGVKRTLLNTSWFIGGL